MRPDGYVRGRSHPVCGNPDVHRRRGAGAALALPTALGKFTNTPGAWLVAAPGNASATIIGKLTKNTRLEVTDKAPTRAFNKSSPGMNWWKVTVVGGAFAGRVGWMMETTLGDAKVP